MTLPNWKAIPLRTKRSRKRLHNLIADEFNLDSWTELPNPIKRSKRKLFNYYAEELHLEEFKELLKQEVRSTREYYNYLKENANPSSAPTLTITVKSGESNVSGASVTIGSTTKSTGSDGKATFELEYGDYEATISAEGYATVTEELAFRSNHKNFEIELEAETPVVTTGTVTITVQYEFDGQTEPGINKDVMLYTGDTPPTQQDDSMLVSHNVTNDEGVAEMTVYDTSTHQATEVTDIPFGTYTLFASDYDVYSYTGTLTVDGDETVTITLIEAGGK